VTDGWNHLLPTQIHEYVGDMDGVTYSLVIHIYIVREMDGVTYSLVIHIYIVR
jgi:hypothetical protein